MQHIGWIIYIYCVLLAFLSYLICYFGTGRKVVPLKEYLFSGNKPFISVSSIVGSIVSAALLLTAVSVAYIQYGIITYIFLVASNILGFVLLSRKMSSLLSRVDMTSSIPAATLNRFELLGRHAGNIPAYLVINILYLFGMTIAEIAAFQAAMTCFVPNDAWSSLSIYFIVLGIGAYVYVGGFRGVLTTDVIQFGLILGVLVVLANAIQYDTLAPNALSRIVVSNPTPLILWIITAVILTTSWFCSAPELFPRLLTLRSPKPARSVLSWSAAIVPLIGLIPIMLLLSTEKQDGGQSLGLAGFEVWHYFRYGYKASTHIAFLLFVTTAVFTSISTYIMTVVQLLTIYPSRNSFTFFQELPRHARKLGALFLVLAFFLAKRLPPSVIAIVGIYSLSLVIPLFIMLYVRPALTKRFRLRYVPGWVWFAPHLPAPIIGYMYVEGLAAGKLVYPLVPLSIAFMQAAFLVAYLLFRRKTHALPR